jgi:hypothetical protein
MGGDYDSRMSPTSPDCGQAGTDPAARRFPAARSGRRTGDIEMADGNSGGGNSALAFIVGGLVVVVAVIGFLVYGGNLGSPSKTVDVNIKPPAISMPAAPAKPG